MIFRFLTAIGVGAEYSAINAAIGELVPARYRGRVNASVMNFWPIGAILAGLITLYFIHLLPPSVGWRLAFGLGAVTALFTLWARRVLPESPRWLAGNGRTAEAQAISQQIAVDRPRFDPAAGTAHTRLATSGFFSQIRILARRYPGRLALGCALDFFEASGYYGLFALLPLVVLPALQLPHAECSRALCSFSSLTTGLRPPSRPRAAAAASPALVRSRIRSRSNWPSAPNT